MTDDQAAPGSQGRQPRGGTAFGGKKKSYARPEGQDTAALARQAEQDLIRRVPPHSVEAEQAVLGGLLVRSGLMHSMADLLKPEDFYLPAHQIIFRCFLDLYAQSAPLDLVAIAEMLRAKGELEQAGGTVYLAELSKAVVLGANAEYYAGIVGDKALTRNLIEACAGIISNAYDASRPIKELLDESEQAVFSVSRRTAGQDFCDTRKLLDDVFDNLAKLADRHDSLTGVTTGYKQLNLLTAGLQPSDLIIVAARPSMGKTAFALCVALHAALDQKVPVGIFSLEMSKVQLMQRMLASWAKVDLSRLRDARKLKDEDWQRLYEAADKLQHAPVYIDDSPALSTLELRARARRLKAEKGLGLLVIDYLQLMRASRRTDSRELEISEISRALKGLAKELDIPVLALSQLNRKLEERTDKRPMLADLRESGAIEQDADVILFVYREDVYKYKNPAERPPQGMAEIIIGKQRNGPVGVAELIYYSPYTSFESQAPEWNPPPQAG